ncbi:hypothetical protein B484DRAFT_455649 [Ochromonadaceae sp. CCMP2298]|nr:hypothetical protein B484DRAFT_455649 [Ochromonadaceae sp. CCMP2298]|eukprot:CAMPEP_0173281708 /NCGR_PEP_ID=MMETSP1143-20121109/6393_1 /TAXON_ID=483371 /ORGANISM="non described non described, Strain CCMP2298" /LENGTH=429 /DNA_ID=CAMNT_0014219155 /DNA_START=1 /DNA_END=1290 /DNA_ORIENTATION=-
MRGDVSSVAAFAAITSLLMGAVLCGAASSTVADEIVLPIQFAGAGGANSFIEFRCRRDEPALDMFVTEFCEEHNVRTEACSALMQIVLKEAQSRSAVAVSSNGSGNLASGPDDVELPNSHLVRYEDAVAAEKRRIFQPEQFDSAVLEVERALVETYRRLWAAETGHTKLVCVIHSCTLRRGEHRVLLHILHRLQSAGLLQLLDDLIVLNVGHEVGAEVQGQFPGARWVQVGGDNSLFEIPALRAAHALAQILTSLDRKGLFLYMHTKGVSYSGLYPQIEDWLDMMLYYTVDRHSSCRHLLESGEIDCVGTNFKSQPVRMFSGNFFWTTAAHLSRLSELRYEESGKYEAEAWLLSAPPTDRTGVRIFVPHSTNINHARCRYPRSCYSSDPYRPDASTIMETAPSEAESGACNDPCGIATTATQRKYWLLL